MRLGRMAIRTRSDIWSTDSTGRESMVDYRGMYKVDSVERREEDAVHRHHDERKSDEGQRFGERWRRGKVVPPCIFGGTLFGRR